MSEVTHAYLAIRNGRVSGVLGLRDDAISRDFLMVWAMDPAPIDIARKSFEATEDEVRAMLAERSKP